MAVPSSHGAYNLIVQLRLIGERPTPRDVLTLRRAIEEQLLDAGVDIAQLVCDAGRAHGMDARLVWVDPLDVLIPADQRRHFALPGLLPPGMVYLPEQPDGLLRCGVGAAGAVKAAAPLVEGQPAEGLTQDDGHGSAGLSGGTVVPIRPRSVNDLASGFLKENQGRAEPWRDWTPPL
jgi:hypothetical protein